MSHAARLTLLDETGWTFREARWREDTEYFLGRDVGDMVVWKAGDFAAGPASGSYQTRGHDHRPGNDRRHRRRGHRDQ